MELLEKLIVFLREQTSRQLITAGICIAAMMPLWLVAAFLFNPLLLSLPEPIRQALCYSLALTFYLALCMVESSRRKILFKKSDFPYMGVGITGIATLAVCICVLFFINRLYPVPFHAVVVIVFGKALVFLCAYQFLFYLTQKQ